jgi:hypothetical protein
MVAMCIVLNAVIRVLGVWREREGVVGGEDMR